MADITMQTIADALKTYYLPVVVEQMNYQSSAFYAEIEKNSEEVEGSTIKMAMKYGRNGGVGNRSETGLLPTAGARKYKQAQYETKNIYARVQFSDKILRIGKTDRNAFVNVLNSSLDDLMADAKDSFARQLYGDGTGKLATCDSNSSTTTLVVDNVQYLAEGMLVDVLQSDGSAKSPAVTEREIEAVDDINSTIEISGDAISTADTDIIVAAGSYGLELTGMGSLCATSGSIYGLDRATYKFLVPTIINVNGYIDEIQIQRGIDRADRRAGAKVDFILCSDGVARDYQYVMGAMRQNIEIMELKGGWKTMSYNGIPFVKDKYCPSGSMFNLAKGDFKIHQIDEWDWMEKDGALLSRVSNKPVYEATIVKYADLGCRKPGGVVKMENITEVNSSPAA